MLGRIGLRLLVPLILGALVLALAIHLNNRRSDPTSGPRSTNPGDSEEDNSLANNGEKSSNPDVPKTENRPGNGETGQGKSDKNLELSVKDAEALLFSGEKKDDRKAAANKLFKAWAESGESRHLELLKMAARTERDPDVRTGLLFHLRYSSDSEAIKIISDALLDPNQQVRSYAASTLKFLATKKYFDGVWTVAPEGVKKIELEPEIKACREVALHAVDSALARESDSSIREILAAASRDLIEVLKSNKKEERNN